jgi:hypothetical protein
MITNKDITWEFLDKLDEWPKDLAIQEPVPVLQAMPDWFKNLKGNIKEYFADGFGRDNTARHCLGLRELAHIGYTCATPIDIRSNDYDASPWGGLNFHPYVLHGTKWANAINNTSIDEHLHNYEWNLRLLKWPWRAKLPKGHKLLITSYMLSWSDDWFAFAGGIPSLKKGDNRAQTCSIELEDNFDYFNLEQVIAIRTGYKIQKGTYIFTVIPLKD